MSAARVAQCYGPPGGYIIIFNLHIAPQFGEHS